MTYRTRTYISADWTDDKDAVDQLIKWNNSNYWGLSFLDAHELSKSYDESLNCTIKKNCSGNLDHSKFFVLIIGSNTKNLRAGYCSYCSKRNNCHYIRQNKSYVEYECDYAIRNNLPIIVLYNSTTVDKSKCIDSVVSVAKAHAQMVMRGDDNKLYWDYQTVKATFDKLAMTV